MLIDFHTHAFPPKLAQRAMAQLSHSAGGLEPQTDGTLVCPPPHRGGFDVDEQAGRGPGGAAGARNIQQISWRSSDG